MPRGKLKILGDSIEANSNDILIGSNRADYIWGFGGNDSIDGKQGNDVIFGGDGNDFLTGNDGLDRLTGGAGDDTFYFYFYENHTNNTDVIFDFAPGNDKIQLDYFRFSGIVQNQLADLTTDYLRYDQSTGELSYDRDGSGASYSPIVIAKLLGQPDLQFSDIVLTHPQFS